MTTVDEREVWKWLEAVPDPEVPAVSVVDLGIVRGIAWRGDELVVTVTPTYSGCPATAVIARDIEAALRGHGIARIGIETQLAPPWTTAWLTPRGREGLRAFGIAPPVSDLVGIAPAVACPQCGAPVDQATASHADRPTCEYCHDPLPATSLGLSD